MKNFENVTQETQELFDNIVSNTAIPTHIVRFKLLTDNDQKQLYKLSKTNPIYQYLLNVEIVCVINENIFDMLEDEHKKLALEEMIGGIYYDNEKDSLKVNKPDVNTHSGIIRKYGLEEYLRYCEILNLSLTQETAETKK